ncbi:hypothetical protein GCK72_022469 [Caenorhabditis remanei]|uniref:Uncharacterized protein n=1 Tax=Caenorhabditis remanei TaxID=31234 RepID=A0A6A5FTT7_CAERE|nr:hypothetical protein GCK72_022469 [Caenorhabditis remanei]KAF1746018.1 hypothetical protein GCK72_022469 [Caenorhabditis remanei]
MNSRKSAPEKMMSTDYMLPVTDNFGNEMQMSTKQLATKSAPAESVANDDDDYPDPPCPKKVSTKAYNPSSWMETQARKAEFPTPAEGEIKVATLFKGFEPLIINVCLDCRTFNSKRDTQEVSPGMVEILYSSTQSYLSQKKLKGSMMKKGVEDGSFSRWKSFEGFKKEVERANSTSSKSAKQPTLIAPSNPSQERATVFYTTRRNDAQYRIG